MKIFNVRIDKFSSIYNDEGYYKFYYEPGTSRIIECIKYGDEYYDIITGQPYTHIKDAENKYIQNPESLEENVLYAFEVKEKEYEDPSFEDIKSLVRATHLLSKLNKNK